MERTMMLEVMRECRNFFVHSCESGDFWIEGGVISLRGDYAPGQYVLLSGSLLNDGLYLLKDRLYSLKGTQDESFTGTVYGLRVPRDFAALCEEIADFHAKDQNANLLSESVLGAHSYTVATDGKGRRARWQDVFSKRLAPFRRMFTEVKL